MDVGKLWQACLADIKTEVSTGNYYALFHTTVLVSLEADVATIAAPSPIVISMIQKKYLPILKNALEKQVKKEVTIVFVAKAVEVEARHTKKAAITDSPLFNATQDGPKKVIGHLPRVRPDFTFQTLAVS